MSVEVRGSDIHGTGAFAAQDFKKGELVLTIDDSYWRTDMKSGVRGTYALKDIRKGEELTWDYAINPWEAWEIPAECRCGSPNCRKVILGSFFLLPTNIQLRYIPLLDQPFRERFGKEIAAIESSK